MQASSTKLRLTKSRVVTLLCASGFSQYWKAWRMSHPGKPVHAPSEERSVARLWNQEGLLSDAEAWRMMEGRQVWQPI